MLTVLLTDVNIVHNVSDAVRMCTVYSEIDYM